MTITECSNPKCGRMFRDAPDTAGICPTCGHQTPDEDDDHIPAQEIRG